MLFTARPRDERRVSALGERLGIQITAIGRILPGRDGMLVIDADGRRSPLEPKG